MDGIGFFLRAVGCRLPPERQYSNGQLSGKAVRRMLGRGRRANKQDKLYFPKGSPGQSNRRTMVGSEGVKE